MASAILPSGNDRQSSTFNHNYPNSNFNFTKLQNLSNQNPNPNFTRYPNSTNCYNGNMIRDVQWRNNQEMVSCGQNKNIVQAKKYITFRLDSYSKLELKSLRKRLISDLERVRMVQHYVYSVVPVCETSMNCNVQEVKLREGEMTVKERERSGIRQKRTNHRVLEVKLPEEEMAVKEREKSGIGVKRTKLVQSVRDTLREVEKTVKEREKSVIGQKRMKAVESVRDAREKKKGGGGRVTNAQRKKLMMRECGQILGKLMKHKHGWVFNNPVDAAALKLYDYHNVVSNPMDLGTIKLKMSRNEYECPLGFASDVRLTFENAMLYNGRGSAVFDMAEGLLMMFEDMFRLLDPKFVVNKVRKRNCAASVPVLVEKLVPNVCVVVEPPTPPPPPSLVACQPKAANSGRAIVRAANKPQMTSEEKAELAGSFLNLQLGQDETNQLMAIVKKRMSFEHEGGEIELDLAVLDNETLWELHRFIAHTLKEKTAATAPCNMKEVQACEPEQCMKSDYGEEYVDIGDEMQITDFPMIEIEKDCVDGCSSSSDSSSDSDSSSSDSGNSCNEQEVNSTPNGVVH